MNVPGEIECLRSNGFCLFQSKQHDNCHLDMSRWIGNDRGERTCVRRKFYILHADAVSHVCSNKSEWIGFLPSEHLDLSMLDDTIPIVEGKTLSVKDSTVCVSSGA